MDCAQSHDHALDGGGQRQKILHYLSTEYCPKYDCFRVFRRFWPTLILSLKPGVDSGLPVQVRLVGRRALCCPASALDAKERVYYGE